LVLMDEAGRNDVPLTCRRRGITPYNSIVGYNWTLVKLIVWLFPAAVRHRVDSMGSGRVRFRRTPVRPKPPEPPLHPVGRAVTIFPTDEHPKQL
jgi:hypothetical protein